MYNTTLSYSEWSLMKIRLIIKPGNQTKDTNKNARSLKSIYFYKNRKVFNIPKEGF